MARVAGRLVGVPYRSRTGDGVRAGRLRRRRSLAAGRARPMAALAGHAGANGSGRAIYALSSRVGGAPIVGWRGLPADHAGQTVIDLREHVRLPHNLARRTPPSSHWVPGRPPEAGVGSTRRLSPAARRSPSTKPALVCSGWRYPPSLCRHPSLAARSLTLTLSWSLCSACSALARIDRATFQYRIPGACP